MIVEHQVQIALTLGTRPANEAIAVSEGPGAGAKAQAAEQPRAIEQKVTQLGAGHGTVAQVMMLGHHLTVKQTLRAGVN